LLCSGKIYYDLDDHRQKEKIQDVAIGRLEQIYPFPEEQLSSLLSACRSTSDVVWVQEESRNMGAWSFVSERLRELLGPEQTLRYVGRSRSSSPATGSYKRHAAEEAALLERAFRPD
jgi:2-oxoglutarate dehydrogenase E1 component